MFNPEHSTTGEDVELKVEYRAAILLDRQADRIELLEATLRSLNEATGSDEARQLVTGALDYPADKVPNAISSEDGEVAWVEVTPITETPEQVAAALRVNGLRTVEDDGTVYGYDVGYRTWMVPCAGQNEDLPLLTHEAVKNVEWDEDIVYFERPEHEGCETGSWWWHCDESVTEPEGAHAD